jgi:hypothetical protein
MVGTESTVDGSDRRGTGVEVLSERGDSAALGARLPEGAFTAVEGARSPAERAGPSVEPAAETSAAERWRLKRASVAVTTYVRERDNSAAQAEYVGDAGREEIPFWSAPPDRAREAPPCRVVTAQIGDNEDVLPVDSDITKTIGHAESMSAAIKALAEFVEFQAPGDVDIEWVPSRPSPDLVIPKTDTRHAE